MISIFSANQSRLAKLLAVLLFIGLLTACGNPHQLVFKSGDMTQTLAEGKSAMPDDFKDFVFPDATAAGSVSAQGDNNEQSKFLMLSCKRSADTVSKWYQDKLKSNNWKMINVQEQPKLISLVGHKGDSELNIMITEDNGTTSISLSLANQVEDNANNDETNRENYAPNKATPPTD
jgi:hypothetical protein